VVGGLGERQGSAGASGSQIAQRSRVTIIAMAVSATCCVLTAVFFENIYAVMAISLVWGISIIADSAQFSAVSAR